MNPVTAEYRRRQLALRALTLKSLLTIWPTLDVNRLDETFPGWLLAVGGLIRSNRSGAIALASRYVRDLRAAAGVAGDAVVVPAAAMPEEGALVTSLRVTSVVAVKSAVSRGNTREEARNNAFVLSSGEVIRHVLDGGRQTVISSAFADPQGGRWRRVGSGRACGFCAMLIGRGAVYRSESTGDFPSHSHCDCSAEPVYSGQPTSDGMSEEFSRQFHEVTDGLHGKDAVRAFNKARR